MNTSGELVKCGRFLYDGQLLGVVRILMTSWRPGTGDYEDLPEWRDDQEGVFFEIQYELPTSGPTARGGGGYCKTLEEAVRLVEDSVEGVSWDHAEQG